MREKPLVINLYGGPGIGKSTTAAHVFALLKQRDVNAELVREYAKDIVWEGRTHLLSGVFPYQLVIFSKQNKRMFDLVGKVDVIVTDSPLWLSYHYSGHDEQMLHLIKRTVDWYDEVHFFLRRQKKFNPMGRMHNEKESKLIDMQLAEMLNNINIEYVSLDVDECAADIIIDETKEKIWPPKG